VNLRIPGPTPLSPQAREALGQDVIGHREPEFEALLHGVTQDLRYFFQTTSDVLVVTASGTGGLEAAVVNVLSPGDKVLAISAGVFGERFAAIAGAHGASVLQVSFPWGQGLDVRVVEQALRGNPDARLLLTTHNETSTGVLHDLGAVAEVLVDLDATRPLWLVDAVSSLGAVELPMHEWGCDLVISASQKAWMAPPGLAFVGVSARAWDAMSQARCPRFYWDLSAAREYASRGQTPFTPAVSALFALQASLCLMRQEGLPAIVARHRALAERLRNGLRTLGLALFADEQHASPTVTAVCVPEGISAIEVKSKLARDHNVIVATGQGPLKDHVLRIAHMGRCSRSDIDHVLRALDSAFRA